MFVNGTMGPCMGPGAAYPHGIMSLATYPHGIMDELSVVVVVHAEFKLS